MGHCYRARSSCQAVHDFEYQIALEEVINDELSRQVRSRALLFVY